MAATATPTTSVWTTLSGILLVGWLAWMMFGEKGRLERQAAELSEMRRAGRKRKRR